MKAVFFLCWYGGCNRGSKHQQKIPTFRWDYRWMDYPGMGRDVRHPYDQSLMTYKGHLVLRTLIRCYFSPLARCALNPPIPTFKLCLNPCVCDQSFEHPIQIWSMQVTMMIENLGCWGTVCLFYFSCSNCFYVMELCSNTIKLINLFTLRKVNKDAEKNMLGNMIYITHWWCFMGAALDKNTFTLAHMMAVYTSLTW